MTPRRSELGAGSWSAALRLAAAALASAAISALALPASADVGVRLSVDQHGDFALIGNTLAHNCMAGVGSPLVGSVGACGDDSGDSGADVFWSVGAGAAAASTAVSLAEASSVAVLELPQGAAVTHARLYWSALAGGGDTSRATLARAGGFSLEVPASVTTLLVAGGDEFYQSSADVTALVQAEGAGAYQLGGIDAADVVDLDSEVSYAGWWMVVLYELASEPRRNLTLFDGFELVSEDGGQQVTLSGFEVPAGGFDAKLAVIAYEGDASFGGDELRFGPDAPLGPGDALLDSEDFFDSSRQGTTGDGASVAGDLPRLSGDSGSMSGLDLDVVDVTDRVTPGQTSAAISAITDFDLYLLAGFVTSVTTFSPNLAQSVKSVSDVNGAPLRPGDELEYTVTVTNSGTDAAVEVLLLDLLPAAVSYVPGSLAIVSGAGAGGLTDAADADRGELDRAGAAETLVVRLGTGAGAALGGRLEIGESSVVRYRVTVDVGASGSIQNQAEISAVGELGGEGSVTPTDGNLAGPGAPPTEIGVDDCTLDSDCTDATPRCDGGASPRRCVECVVDADCPGLTPTCSTGRVCACVGSGVETSCDGRDDNCNGQIDEGFAGVACTSGIGACTASGVTVCDTEATTRCAATPAAPGGEECSGGGDEDCDGLVDIDDPDCTDQDADGIADGVELELGTNPSDADSDDDGVADGAEPSFDVDTDVDGLVNALDGDSDNDGLLDGTELGLLCSGPGTRPARCVADADEAETTTSPLVADTDGGGAIDGSEDTNLDGVQDEGESDPNRSADDDALRDTDNDVLSDALERFLGSNRRDADTDDDGLSDGLEPNPSIDVDEDGLSSVLDADSDNDGLFDGTETGHACDDPATRDAAGVPAALVTCRADADPTTKTSALAADSDRGGASDGREDLNGDGRVDAGETDPLEPGDDDLDSRCGDDLDCSAPLSGRVCVEGSCIQGCRLFEAATCPAGYACEVVSADLGRCSDGTSPGGDAGADPGSEPDPGEDDPIADLLPPDEIGASLAGGECGCRLATSGHGGAGLFAMLAIAGALASRRRGSGLAAARR